MKNKLATSKKIAIASILIGVIVIAAIVSIVLVLAATQQTVSSNISVSYVVDGVSAKVSATYATVPNSGTVTKTSMTGENSKTELEFEMSDSATTQDNPVQLNPGEVELNSTTKKVVYEYKFTNLATSAFTITLIEDIENTNMKIRYKVSKTALSGNAYQQEFTDTTLLSQAMVEQDRDLYIYVSVEVDNLNNPASYTGEFVWVLLKNDNFATVTINNNGGSGATTMKVIKGANIAYPMVYNVPTNGSKLFNGFYSAATGGTRLINPDGSSASAVGATAPTTIYAQWGTDSVVMNGTQVVGLTPAGEAAGRAVIPSSATSIADSAFENNTTLTNVVFAGGETLAYADTSSLTTIGTNAFKGCTGLTELIIPEGVTSIGAGALQNLSSVEHLVIPSTVTTLPGTFTANAPLIGTTKIEKLECHADVLSCGKEYTDGGSCSGLDALYGYGGYDDEGNSFWFGTSGGRISKVIINAGTTLSKSIFYRETSIKEVILPEGLKIIEDATTYEKPFYETSITTITIPSSLTTIGSEAFSGCRNLTSVTFGENSQLTSILDQAFSNCDSLSSIEIPSSVTSIGYEAFSACYSLVQVRNLSGQTMQGYTAPSYAEVLTNNTAFKSVLEIGSKYAIFTNGTEKVLLFATDKTITTATDLPSDITQIGQYAFYYCGSLTSIEIPSSITNIGNYAFYYCSSLISIEIPSSVTSIGGGAFSGCSKLTSVTFKNTTGWAAYDGTTKKYDMTVTNATTNATNLKNTSSSGTTGWGRYTLKRT